jgi:hypothetical protein
MIVLKSHRILQRQEGAKIFIYVVVSFVFAVPSPFSYSHPLSLSSLFLWITCSLPMQAERLWKLAAIEVDISSLYISILMFENRRPGCTLFCRWCRVKIIYIFIFKKSCIICNMGAVYLHTQSERNLISETSTELELSIKQLLKKKWKRHRELTNDSKKTF